MPKKKVVLIGTNGIPAHYGGIETLAEYLARDLNEDYELYCYCSKTPKEKQLQTYRNTKLIYVPLKANGWQSILYDGWTILQALWKYDVLLILGCSNPIAPFFNILHKKKIVYNAIGGREVDKVRGINALGKLEVAVKKWLGSIPVKYSQSVIIDNNANLQEFIAAEKRVPIVAEYGGDHAQFRPITADMVDKYPFLSRPYDVTVSRAQEDMNIHMVIDAYKEVTKRTVVIISNWEKTEYGLALKAENKGKYSNIILLDAIYNQDELNVIRSNAAVYLHTHSMCGTAPSLVEAMYLGLPVISFKVPTNLETTEQKALFFESVPELVTVLNGLSSDKLKSLGLTMKEIADRRYQWKRITDIYKKCIEN
jgi:glycosyltransferase involved in cell wall biosynthesis